MVVIYTGLLLGRATTDSWQHNRKQPAMHIRKQTRPKQPVPAMSATKLREYVDFLTSLYRLDPDLPELATLKAEAKEIVAQTVPHPNFYLAMLNPDADVNDYEGVPVLSERMFGHILQPWSLARHHCRQIDKELVRIVADGQGTHLYASFLREHEAFCIMGAAINPHRFADPGNRYANACGIIRQFTGIEINYLEHVGSTRKITANKDLEGSWSIEFDRVPATPAS